MSTSLTTWKIFRFWLPLASTWLMMSVEGPLLAALIARLPEAKFNLAAYGVAFSFALIIEAPVIMMMSASTALVKDRGSYFKLRNFTFLLISAITLALLLLLVPDIFNRVAIDWIGLPGEVADLTYVALALLLPWPGVIGYRRFFQGILIRADRTRRVAYGTVVRLISMAAVALLCYWTNFLPGAWVGALALSSGVTAEAIASRIMAHQDVQRLLRESDTKPEAEELTYRGIGDFYMPLAMTSLLAMGVHPMTTFFVGQSRMALDSLAVLPVVNSLVFIFRSLGLAYQEVGIALIGEGRKGYRPLRNFCALLMGAASFAICLMAFTPLQNFWFATVSGLAPELTSLAGSTMYILVITPALTILLTFQRATLVNLRKTRPITLATGIEVAGIALVLLVAIRYLDMVGAYAAALAMVVGRLGANTFLTWVIRREWPATVEAPLQAPLAPARMGATGERTPPS